MGGVEQPTAEKVAQLATPCAMQLAITPIHLLGLNLYNTPVATPSDRMKAVAKNCPEATGVRMLRFFWAYGVGGLVNKALNERAQHGACTDMCEFRLSGCRRSPVADCALCTGAKACLDRRMHSCLDSLLGPP